VNAKLPPAASVPEFHPLASDVEVCAIESLFVQVTVVPEATVTGFGLYARVPRLAAAIGIETAVPEGVGGGGVGELGNGVE
jgi:hypothetical protein